MALLLKEMILVRDSRATIVVGVEESTSTTSALPTRARIPGSVVEQDQGYKEAIFGTDDDSRDGGSPVVESSVPGAELRTELKPTPPRFPDSRSQMWKI